MTAPGADVFTRATYVIEDGVRGLNRTIDNPPTPATGVRAAPPSDAQIIADTIREETGG